MLLGIVGQAWHLVTALVLYAFLARRLGPALFGQWSVALSVLAWFEIFVTASLVKVTTRAISKAPADMPRSARAGYVGQLLVGSAVFGLVMVVAGPIAGLLADPSLATLIRIAALDIPLYAAFMMASAVVLGEKRFERQALAWIIYATAKAGFILAMVLLGFSVKGALVGNALSSLVGFAAIFVPIRGRCEPLAELWPLVRIMLVASTPFLVLALLEGLGQSVDLWLVSALTVNAALVGFYASANVLAEVPLFLFIGLNRALFPSVTSARERGDEALVASLTTQGVRLAIIVTVIAIALVTSVGRQLLVLVYSAPYVGAFTALVLLMVAALGRTLRATCSEVLMAEDRRRAALSVIAVTVVLEIVLVAVLTPRFSLGGAAAGTAVSALTAGVWAVWLLRAKVGLRPLTTLARCAVASAAVGGVLYWLAPVPRLAPVAVLVGGLVYLGLVAALGEFDSADVTSIRSAVGR